MPESSKKKNIILSIWFNCKQTQKNKVDVIVNGGLISILDIKNSKLKKILNKIQLKRDLRVSMSINKNETM